MKNDDYIIETSNESLEQTFRNGMEYYNVAIMLLREYDSYNFFINEDLDLSKLKDKYTKMNVIFMNFSFAYENLMKYLLLKNRLNLQPNLKRDELWGKWIYKHGIKQLYDLASENDNYKIYNFCNSFLRILNISKVLSEFRLLSKGLLDYPHDPNYFSADHIEWEIETWEGVNDMFKRDDLLKFITDNDELFIRSRYSGQIKTKYNFTDIYYFIQGIYTYASIIHSKGGIVPANIEREYIKYKIDNSNIKAIISKRYSEEEISELMDIIKDNALLIRILLGADCYNLRYYSLEEIKRILESDVVFEDEHYLYLTIVCGITYEDILEQKQQGKNIKDFIISKKNEAILEAEKLKSDNAKSM